MIQISLIFTNIYYEMELFIILSIIQILNILLLFHLTISRTFQLFASRGNRFRSTVFSMHKNTGQGFPGRSRPSSIAG